MSNYNGTERWGLYFMVIIILLTTMASCEGIIKIRKMEELATFLAREKACVIKQEDADNE